MFRFKQFSVIQEKSAMKVGTDSILLGSWAQFDASTTSVLDIGSGTGLLSLMIAQRYPNIKIEAIEINKDAFEEGKLNFANSKWAERILPCYGSFQELLSQKIQSGFKYDAIISNPPYFSETVQPKEESRRNARNTSSLSFEELLSGVAKLLNEAGIFVAIVPFQKEIQFLEIAKQQGLYTDHICRLRGNPKSALKRSLLKLRLQKREPVMDELVIENTRHQYTEDFIRLTQEFYLDF